MNRRSFLRGAGLLLAAPAIVKVASIMPVRAPQGVWLYQFGDSSITFSGFSSQIPIYALMNPADWHALFGDTSPWPQTAMEDMAMDAPRAP